MDQLTALNAANPHISIYSVYDVAFRAYGRVIAADTAAICKTAEDAVAFPSEDSKYLASVPALEAPLRELFARGWIGQCCCLILKWPVRTR